MITWSLQDGLRRHGPFDVVIDAANVGLYKSKSFWFFSGKRNVVLQRNNSVNDTVDLGMKA